MLSSCFAAHGSSRSGSPTIIAPAVLGGILLLALLLIAILIVVVMRRRKRQQSTKTGSPVIYTNHGGEAMDNPVYMGKDLFDSTTSLPHSPGMNYNTHTDDNIYEREDDYATVNDGQEFMVSSSREDLLFSPLYTTIKK